MRYEARLSFSCPLFCFALAGEPEEGQTPLFAVLNGIKDGGDCPFWEEEKFS